jgi:hypothetical protein
VVGGLLHDVGKVGEYVWEGRPIDVSRNFFLTSHVCSGVQLVHAAIAPAREALHRAGLTVHDVEHLCHVITSHHGQPEWGAPVPPATLEATLIHHADNACAKAASLAEDLATCTVGADGWADPTGWKRRPIWVARGPAARGDRLVDAHAGRAAVAGALRTLLDVSPPDAPPPDTSLIGDDPTPAGPRRGPHGRRAAARGRRGGRPGAQRVGRCRRLDGRAPRPPRGAAGGH